MFAHAMLLVDNTMKPFYPLCLLAVLLWTACTHADYSRRMAEADRVMDLYPDSALRLLQDISPSDLEEGDRMRHRLLTVEAECRNDIFTADDSLMETLTDYFRQVKNSVMLARVYYNWGMLYGGRQRYDAALVAYKQAIAPAVQAKDWHLLGRVYGNMGYLLQNNGLDVQADSLYHQAERMARLSGDTLLWAETLHRQAIYQMGQGERGYPKAERLLRLSYDMLEDNHRAGVALSFSYLYSHMEMGEKALYYAKEAVRLRQQDTLQLFRAYVVLGDVFYKATQYDSARYYFLQGMHSEVLEVKIGACIRLAAIARKLDDWKQVAYYQEQERLYKDVYNEQKQREQIVLAQQEQAHQQEQAQMKRLVLICLAVIGVLAVCIVLLLGWRIKERKRRRRQMDALMKYWWQEHRVLLSAEPSMAESEVRLLPPPAQREEQPVFDFDGLPDCLRETDPYVKAKRILAHYKSYADYEEHFTVEDQDQLLHCIDLYTDGFIARLKKKASLSESDLRFCGLHLLEWSTQEIAVLLEKDRSGVYKRQKRILHHCFPEAGDEKLEKVLKSIK